jgi:hypothetical protein
MYALYGDELGARIARKHVGWYARALPAAKRCGAPRTARRRSVATRGRAAFFDALLDPQRETALRLAA